MDTLTTPLCETLGIEHPVFLAGMGGVAYAEVCAAVSEAGGFGCIGAAGMDPDWIREQIQEVRRLTDKPFGVDVLTALPDQVPAQAKVICEEGVAAFVAGLGVPGPVIEMCHEAGLQVFNLCGKVKHARRAEEAGVDVLVAQGTEAGGHTGKIGGMALVPQIVDAVSSPVLAAGGLYDGRGLAAALSLGAQGVWMGTRFIASQEAHADGVYKHRIKEIDDEDTLITRCYSGKPMRVIDNPYAQSWEQRADEIQPFPAQFVSTFRDNAMKMTQPELIELDPDLDCMPCGQGAGGIDDIPTCAEIVERVVSQASAILTNLAPH
jgi:enoyl-[acyl-carrier protein] reductase II